MNIVFIVLDRVLETLLVVALGSMCVVVALGIFFRFVLSDSLSWADEVAMLLLVWMTFLGAALAMRDKTHYTFSYFVRTLKGNTQRFVRILGNLLTMAMILGLLYWSTKATLGIRDWVMPALGISRAFAYGACPVGTLFLFLYALRDFIRLCQKHTAPLEQNK